MVKKKEADAEVVELKKGIVLEWLKTDGRKRVPRSSKVLCEELGITEGEYRKIYKKWAKEGRDGLVMVEEGGEVFIKAANEERYDSRAWLLSRTEEADAALLAGMRAGNASAMKIYYQLTERLTEAPVIGKVEITSDDYYRAREGARQKAKGKQDRADSGDREMCGESALLLPEACKDRGQGERGSDKVGGVAVSGESTRGDTLA